MKSTKNAMMPQSGIEPLPETKPERQRTPETYSEGGLSGEAVVEDTEPFMLRQRTDKEVTDYDEGFECGQSGGQNDDTKSEAWQQGWAESQE